MKRGEEGKVSETVETYYQRTFREVREQALLEGKLESQIALARRLLADGTFTLERIADLTGLTADQVRGLTV